MTKFLLATSTFFAACAVTGMALAGCTNTRDVAVSESALVAEQGDAQADAGASRDADASLSDGAAAAPTWTTLYTSYFGPNTPGHCGNSGCHEEARSGFKCGTTKAECYAGLVARGLINANAPATSELGDPQTSPLVWFGGSMPADDATLNPAAAAAVTAWLAAGAKNN